MSRLVWQSKSGRASFYLPNSARTWAALAFSVVGLVDVVRGNYGVGFDLFIISMLLEVLDKLDKKD
jgi:hypothetical protein